MSRILLIIRGYESLSSKDDTGKRFYSAWKRVTTKEETGPVLLDLGNHFLGPACRIGPKDENGRPTFKRIDKTGATFLTLFQAFMHIPEEEKADTELQLELEDGIGELTQGLAAGIPATDTDLANKIATIDPFYYDYINKLRDELAKFKTVEWSFCNTENIKELLKKNNETEVKE